MRRAAAAGSMRRRAGPTKAGAQVALSIASTALREEAPNRRGTRTCMARMCCWRMEPLAAPTRGRLAIGPRGWGWGGRSCQRGPPCTPGHPGLCHGSGNLRLHRPVQGGCRCRTCTCTAAQPHARGRAACAGAHPPAAPSRAPRKTCGCRQRRCLALSWPASGGSCRRACQCRPPGRTVPDAMAQQGDEAGQGSSCLCAPTCGEGRPVLSLQRLQRLSDHLGEQ